MDAATLVDSSILILDISAGSSVVPLSSWELDLCPKGSPSPRFSLSPSGLLLMDHLVYVPEYLPEQGNLRTRVLQAKHDHPTAGHFTYNKALELLRRDYVWPSMRTDCKWFVPQCAPCARNKPSSSSSLRLSATLTGPGSPVALYQYGLYRAVTSV